MGNLRPVLIMGLVFLGYLIWVEWQKDYGPAPQPPAVQEAAVFGIPHDKWGETPLAIVGPAPNTSPTPESLKAYCKQNLAGYKVPQLYELVESLPRNPSGKLLKPQLRKRFPGPAPF